MHGEPKSHRAEGERQRPGRPNARVRGYKLDEELSRRSRLGNTRTTRVIVTLVPGAELPPQFRRFARANGKLNIINGQVMDLPNNVLRRLEAHPGIFRVHYDRPIGKLNYRTAVTIGARNARMQYGYTGAGIGVAVIDSGIASWHDDLTRGSAGGVFPYGDQRVKTFVDFVNGQTMPYDDNGHGTHVSGIIAGNGYDSYGNKMGVAPNASIISLKVLDANGTGTISNIIAALNWI
ncbi:MAG: S8 family serine peptidase, partial [Vicinamibacterales bacterium]